MWSATSNRVSPGQRRGPGLSKETLCVCPEQYTVRRLGDWETAAQMGL